MDMFQPVAVSMDRVMATLVAGLEIEFGHGVAEGLAERFLAAEECDFSWDARIEERWLGTYPALEEDDFELDRVAILGRIDGKWFVATCIIDGDAMPHGMTGRRTFASEMGARQAFGAQR